MRTTMLGGLWCAAGLDTYAIYTYAYARGCVTVSNSSSCICIKCRFDTLIRSSAGDGNPAEILDVKVSHPSDRRRP